MGDGDVAVGSEDPAVSQKLAYVIEAELPRPIAVEFGRLRRASSPAAAAPLAANVLGHLLRYAAFVLAAEHLARGEDEVRATLRTAMRQPQSHGQLLGLARSLARSLSDGEPGAPATRIAEVLRDPAIMRHLDRAIELRNAVIKKGDSSRRADLGRAVVESVRAMLFVREWPIAKILSARERAGANVMEAQFFMGAQPPTLGRIETNVELQVGRVYLFDPISRQVLELHPLFVTHGKDDDDAGLCWLSTAKKTPHYETSDGRVHKLKELGPEIVECLEGTTSPRRIQTRFLAVRGDARDVERRRLAPGDVVDGRYRVIDLIGDGGMAQVYEVVDTEDDDRRVALKRLPYEYIRDRAMLARFRREATQMQRLDHPYVTPSLRFGEDTGDHYIVMPLAHGWTKADGSLARDLSQLDLPLALGRSLTIAMQISDGLGYVHSLGIVHRDLKPQNVLLDDDDAVRLTDFGVARMSESLTLTMTGIALGTPEYVAPEQIEGGEIGIAADIYSLGGVLYTLFCGAPPYSGGTPLAIMHAATTKPVPDPRKANPDIPIALATLIKRCLAKKPEDRPRVARDVYEALREVSTGVNDAHIPEPVEGVRPDSHAKGAQPRWRRFMISGAIAAACAIALLVVVAVIARDGSSSSEPARFEAIQLDELRIEGRLLKPQAFYILNRSELNLHLSEGARGAAQMAGGDVTVLGELLVSRESAKAKLDEALKRFQNQLTALDEQIDQLGDAVYKRRRRAITDSQDELIRVLDSRSDEVREQLISHLDGQHPELTAMGMMFLSELYFERQSVAFDSALTEYNLQWQTWEEGQPEPDEPTIDFRRVLEYLQRLYERFPRAELIDRALYLEGYMLQEMMQNTNAVARFERIAKEYPQSPLVAEANLRIGEHYFDLLNDDDGLRKAARAYAYLATREGPNQQLALYKLAWTHLRLGEYPQTRAAACRLAKEGKLGELASESRTMIASTYAFTESAGELVQLCSPGSCPCTPEVVGETAEAFLGYGLYDEARGLFEFGLESFPVAPEAHDMYCHLIDVLNRDADPRAGRLQLDLQARFGAGTEWAVANKPNDGVMGFWPTCKDSADLAPLANEDQPSAIVRNAAPALQRCHENSLLRNRTTSVTMNLVLALDEHGKPEQVAIDEPIDDSFATCATKVLGRLHFPTAPSRDVRVPLVFDALH